MWTPSTVNKNINSEIEKSFEDMEDMYGVLQANYYQGEDFDFDLDWMLSNAKKSFIEWLWDPYTEYFDVEETDSFMDTMHWQEEIVWIWAVLEKIGDYIQVDSVLENSPAQEVGLESMDRIVAVDWISVADEDIDDSAERIKWPKGTIVYLSIQRMVNDEMIEFEMEVVRDEVFLNSVSVSTINTWDANLAYVQIFMIWDETSSIFKKEIAKFDEWEIDWVILDLRGNAWWYMDWAVEIASYFVPKWKTIVRAKYQLEPEEKFLSKWYQWLEDLPVIVIVDGNTASAGEIIAMALEIEPNIETVWTQTFGKGSIQMMQDLNNWWMLKFTAWLRFDGNWENINHIWMVPDFVVELEVDSEWDLLDTQLDFAIENLIWKIEK